MERPIRRFVRSVAITLLGVTSSSAIAQPEFHHLHGGEINGIFFLDSQRGWTAEDGTRVRYTLNGGQTWQYGRVDTTNLDVRVPLMNVFFLDQSNGFAVGTEGVVIASTNGGLTWSDVNASHRVVNNSTATGACGSEKATLFDIFMTSTSIGFVVGDDGVI